LSSVLLLSTIVEPNQEKTDLTFMSVGLGIGNTKIWGKNSFSVNASYNNLAPYQFALPDRNKWKKPVEALSGEMVCRHTFNDDSLLKVYGAFSSTNFDLIQDDINFDEGVRFGLKNRNLYINSSYKNKFGNNWRFETGVSFTNENTESKIIEDVISNTENSAHFKMKLKKNFSNRFKITFGSEYFITDFNEDYDSFTEDDFSYGFDNNLFASFIETDILF
jgi:hypothetical protein